MRTGAIILHLWLADAYILQALLDELNAGLESEIECNTSPVTGEAQPGDMHRTTQRARRLRRRSEDFLIRLDELMGGGATGSSDAVTRASLDSFRGPRLSAIPDVVTGDDPSRPFADVRTGGAQ